MEIMYSLKLDNNYFLNKHLIGFVGEVPDLKVLVNNLEWSKYNINHRVKTIIRNNLDFVKALGLDNKILNRKLIELSGIEYKLIKLIHICLLKPELIILNNFELGINEKIVNQIIRFLRTVNANLNIKMVIISRDARFLNKIVKDIIIMKKGIIKYQGRIIPALKQNLLVKPQIIKFIDLVNQKGQEIIYTLDEKELLKDIYRRVT